LSLQVCANRNHVAKKNAEKRGPAEGPRRFSEPGGVRSRRLQKSRAVQEKRTNGGGVTKWRNSNEPRLKDTWQRSVGATVADVVESKKGKMYKGKGGLVKAGGRRQKKGPRPPACPKKNEE